METATAQPRIRGLASTLLLVFVCFSLASSGYLAWLYHLIELVPSESVDVLSMGVGYACQGAGIALMAAIMRKRPEACGRLSFVALIAFTFACAAPAALSDSLAGTLAFGYAMNVLCGAVSLFYLVHLASYVEECRRGIVFGGGYACSIVATWLFSLIDVPLAPIPLELVACAVFSVVAVATAMLVAFVPPESFAAGIEPARVGPSVIALACITVLLMSMVKNMGFSFPAADIGEAVDLELSRLFYAVGLVVAGIVFDRNRKIGILLCMTALVLPFALIALAGQPLPSMVVWAVDYFFYGFFSVFRVLLFADMAARGNRMYLAGYGLMFGRFGDALGLVVSRSLGGSVVALVAVTAALFAAAMLVFYQLFSQLYTAPPVREKTERELFDDFAVRYELSPREREVVRLALGDYANAEIAAMLFVSESTVKFHMRNVLRKTACKNRMDLLAKYVAETQE